MLFVLDSNNMEPNEQSRRSRDYSSYFETHNNLTRFGSSKLFIVYLYIYL